MFYSLLAWEIERDALGRELNRSHGNNLNTQYRYDPQGRLIAQRTGKQVSSTRYQHDASQRLTQVQGSNPEVFIHDPAGNLLADSPAAPKANRPPATV